MKIFLGKFSFSINSITFVSQLSHIKKIYVPTTFFIVTKVFSSICFQFLLTECSNRVNLQYISRASKMADSDNNQLMNCKNFVTLRNIFNYCTTTRVPKWEDTAVFEFSEEDLWNVHRAESCVVVSSFVSLLVISQHSAGSRWYISAAGIYRLLLKRRPLGEVTNIHI